MKVITAPEYPDLFKLERPFLFLGGGITNCPEWQTEFITLLKDNKGTIFNPRRKHFPIDNPNAKLEQIRWEYLMGYRLSLDAILFWFSIGSNNPIVLFELGCNLNRKLAPPTTPAILCQCYAKKIPIFIGIHPKYERRADVEIQVLFRRSEIKIVYSLEELSLQVIQWIYNWLKARWK